MKTIPIFVSHLKTIVIMKNQIEIISAKNQIQLVNINNVQYSFEFSEFDLSRSINWNNSTAELELKSNLDSSDYNDIEMSQQIASEWNHDDVIVLIESEVEDMSSNELNDYLFINAN